MSNALASPARRAASGAQDPRRRRPPQGPVDAARADRARAVARPRGAAGFQATALRLCHDGERFYVAFHCEDRAIVATHRGRNAPIYEEDVVEAFLAPSGDARRYFELETSPRNAWFEARVENPDGRRATMRVDRDWVCARLRARDATARRRRLGQRIVDRRVGDPVRVARRSRHPSQARAGARTSSASIRPDGGEYSAWSPTFADPPDFHLPDCFGELVFA